MSPSSHGDQRGRNPRISPSITAVQTNTTPSAAAVCRPTAATPPPITAASDAAAPTRSEVVSTSAHHAPSMPTVDPRSIAVTASPADRNATITRVITKTPAAITRMRDANQRRRRGSHVKIVLIVPVCHETATTEAPTTSARMLVIEEIPSRIPGRSASCRWDACSRRGPRSCPRRTPRVTPRMGTPSQSAVEARRELVARLRTSGRERLAPSEGWTGRPRSRHRLPCRGGTRPGRPRRVAATGTGGPPKPISRITRPPRGRLR